MKRSFYRCEVCGKKLEVSRSSSGYQVDGIIALNLPGFLCRDCPDSLLDKIPDPPGLICIKELSEKSAVSCLHTQRFIKNTDEAANFLISLFPSSAAVIDIAAVRLHIQGYGSQASKLLKQGISQSDNPDLLRTELAAMMGFDGHPSKGLSILEEVTNKQGRYYVIKGNLYKDLGKWEEAAQCWRDGIKADPSDFMPWKNLGYYLFHIKDDLIQAETHYRKVVEHFPDDRCSRAYLGDSLFYQGKIQEALTHYEQALGMPEAEEYEETEDFLDSLNSMAAQCRKAIASEKSN